LETDYVYSYISRYFSLYYYPPQHTELRLHKEKPLNDKMDIFNVFLTVHRDISAQ